MFYYPHGEIGTVHILRSGRTKSGGVDYILQETKRKNERKKTERDGRQDERRVCIFCCVREDVVGGVGYGATPGFWGGCFVDYMNRNIHKNIFSAEAILFLVYILAVANGPYGKRPTSGTILVYVKATAVYLRRKLTFTAKFW